MAEKKGTSGLGSSFDAFRAVDDAVSKPVFGSDGAASWQEFRKDVKVNPNRPSAAPKAPLKKTDRLGFANWEEERTHEERVRKEAGHSDAGSGYSHFKKKNSAEEAAERKRIKTIEARIRPESKEYFIPAQTFEGWKFDYVFTTRPERGTGYYWDGMDSIKKLHGEISDDQPSNQQLEDEGPSIEEPEKPKKKKRKKIGPVIVNDPNNPLEQVAALLQRRNHAANIFTEKLPDGWDAAKDLGSEKVYYFNRSTGERTWTKPESPPANAEIATDAQAPLPEGWKAATDAASGRVYYYHTNGETRWDVPQ